MDNTVKAVGVYQHHFYGEYLGTIVLRFTDEQCAADALKTLNGSKVELNQFWLLGKKSGNVLCWTGNTIELMKDRFKTFNLRILPCGSLHCSDQCKNAEIDNVNHSVDLGATFEIDIPIVPAEQESLF
jgi:hypothetical protein